MTLFSTSVSSETGGKGNSLSSGVDLAYYLHGIVLPHAEKFRIIAALLDLSVQRRCGRCKREDIAQIPAQHHSIIIMGYIYKSGGLPFHNNLFRK